MCMQGARIGVFTHLYNASVATQNVNDIFNQSLGIMAQAGEQLPLHCQCLSVIMQYCPLRPRHSCIFIRPACAQEPLQCCKSLDCRGCSLIQHLKITCRRSKSPCAHPPLLLHAKKQRPDVFKAQLKHFAGYHMPDRSLIAVCWPGAFHSPAISACCCHWGHFCCQNAFMTVPASMTWSIWGQLQQHSKRFMERQLRP